MARRGGEEIALERGRTEEEEEEQMRRAEGDVDDAVEFFLFLNGFLELVRWIIHRFRSDGIVY